MPQQPIPVHVILGFLGVGKTTAIRRLLQSRPGDERWAVLVNEFGEVGIDGALLSETGVAVREVPGGCMCCVAGLPMQIGLNMLIQREKPDRLLIEPTGLGHPSKILETLTGDLYAGTLNLASTLCLVDPRRLSEEKVRSNVQFNDQVAVADVLVANKTDLCNEQDMVRFREWAASWEPPKTRIEETQQGRVDPQWLMVPHKERPVSNAHAHDHHHHAQEPKESLSLEAQPWECIANEGDGHYSCGWRIAADYIFSHDELLSFCHSGGWQRLKGVVCTDRGWLALNMVDGMLTVQSVDEAAEIRLEIIDSTPLEQSTLDQTVRGLLI